MPTKVARCVPIVDVPMSHITDWDTFHATFAEALGFPDFYGRGTTAWIDCLSYEDDGMTAFPVGYGDAQRSPPNAFRVAIKAAAILRAGYSFSRMQ
jgi:RNAse (barnase) inhibitor barstar